MKPSIKINTKAADAAFSALAKISMLPVHEVIRAEAGSILKTCIQRTALAESKDVMIRERINVLMGIKGAGSKGDERFSINVGKKGAYGKVWRVIPTSGKRGIQQTHAAGFAPLDRHYKAKTWDALSDYVSRFRAEEKRRVPLALRSIGLTCQSWLQIADSVGIDLEQVKGGGKIPAKKMKAARNAFSSDGRAHKNGYGAEKGTGAKYELTLTNIIPWGNKAGLGRTLIVAVNGRAKFFEKNVALGTFDTIEKTLKAYPNIKFVRL